MNESKAKVEELQRKLGFTNTQRARAQAESGIQTNYLLNKWWKYDEEQEGKSEPQCTLSKANAEVT